VHAPRRTLRWELPFTFSTFDYRTLCRMLFAQGDARFETAVVTGRRGETVHTDRGDLRAPLVVDALGWRRVLGSGANVQPPHAYLSRGLEVHPPARAGELELWLDPKYVPEGYSWAFPAGDEVRVGVGSFDPRFHVKDPTLALAADVGVAPEGFQGNWIPHKLRKAVDDGVFFAGDSAGHCLPVTAEGIRTALYFGLACGRELAAVVEGRRTRDEALARYGEFSDAHAHAFLWMKKTQNLVSRLNTTPLMPWAVRAMADERLLSWSFNHYLAIAPPEFALASPAPPAALPAEPEADTVTLSHV